MVHSRREYVDKREAKNELPFQFSLLSGKGQRGRWWCTDSIDLVQVTGRAGRHSLRGFPHSLL